MDRKRFSDERTAKRTKLVGHMKKGLLDQGCHAMGRRPTTKTVLSLRRHIKIPRDEFKIIVQHRVICHIAGFVLSHYNASMNLEVELHSDLFGYWNSL
jgi:hypothetical protein